MYRQHFWHGNGIVRGTAISGIDIALWDILGKMHGVPCHKLWGGPVRDYVRTYCHLGGGKMEEFYETHPADAGRFADLAAAGRRRRLHRLQVHGRAGDDAHRRAAADPLRRGLRRGHARSGRRTHRHHGRLPCPPVAADGPAVRQGARAVRPVLVRGAVLAGEHRRTGRNPARRRHADRHRRAAGRASTPSASCWKSARAASSSPTSRTAAA